MCGRYRRRSDKQRIAELFVASAYLQELYFGPEDLLCNLSYLAAPRLHAIPTASRGVVVDIPTDYSKNLEIGRHVIPELGIERMCMTNSRISGSSAMVQLSWHPVSGSNDHRAGALYQTSLMPALVAGIYEGDATYGQIRKYGDFGLGTFNDLDGEMAGLDGTFDQLRSDGSTRPVAADQKTPFAVVTSLKPEQELDVAQ